jgi:hypothetical protein
MENDKGDEFSYDILLELVNVTRYPQYNNNIINKYMKKTILEPEKREKTEPR